MARFTNQAQLSYNGAVVNSNIAVGEIVEVLSVRPRRGCDLCYKRGQLGQYSAYGCEHYGRSRRIHLRQRNTLPSGICRRIGQGLCERCPPDIITYGR